MYSVLYNQRPGTPLATRYETHSAQTLIEVLLIRLIGSRSQSLLGSGGSNLEALESYMRNSYSVLYNRALYSDVFCIIQ